MKKDVPLEQRELYASEWMRMALYLFETNNELGMWSALLEWAEALDKENNQ